MKYNMFIILFTGEQICKDCKGRGSHFSNSIVCTRCYGLGKLDWIENARGSVDFDRRLKEHKIFDWNKSKMKLVKVN